MTLQSIKNSLALKIFFIGFLNLMLLIPLNMVSGLIKERVSRRAEAVNEVSEKWGYRQNIVGPVLTIPYHHYYRDAKNILRIQVKHAHFLPESLDIDGDIIPEKRHRGLYDIILYRMDGLKMSGTFSYPDIQKLKIPAHNVLWDDAYVTIGIPDTRGIQKNVQLAWNGRKTSFYPGAKKSGLKSGIHAMVGEFLKTKKKLFTFSFSIDLQGSSSLSFAPMGKETRVKLTSPWQHPSFYGSYLPSEHTITDKGFVARWKVSYFGRNFPHQWTDSDIETEGGNNLGGMNFGVTMYQPVDFYQKSERAVKYGFLFIFLTFLSFFLFEVFSKLKIHPLQYIMIGFAMSIFYLLFLSLSEHMNFIVSYLISCVGVVGMITGYSMTVLKARKRGSVMAGLLTCLYGYLFILLQNEDYTLILGSVALFIILGVVMYITRHVDWYGLKISDES